MTPIPSAALPVVRVLRRDVKRPKRLPTLDVIRGLHCNWSRLRFSKRKDGRRCCPIGLHAAATAAAPSSVLEFPVVRYFAIRDFTNWWDSLPASDARAAVDAVWPKKRKAKR